MVYYFARFNKEYSICDVVGIEGTPNNKTHNIYRNAVSVLKVDIDNVIYKVKPLSKITKGECKYNTEVIKIIDKISLKDCVINDEDMSISMFILKYFNDTELRSIALGNILRTDINGERIVELCKLEDIPTNFILNFLSTKDKSGKYILKLAINRPDEIDLDILVELLISKDKTGYILNDASRFVDNISIWKIRTTLINMSTNLPLLFDFAMYNGKMNYVNMRDKLITIENSEPYIFRLDAKFLNNYDINNISYFE